MDHQPPLPLPNSYIQYPQRQPLLHDSRADLEEPEIEPLGERQAGITTIRYLWRPTPWPHRRESLWTVSLPRRRNSNWAPILIDGPGASRALRLTGWVQPRGFFDTTDVNAFCWRLGAAGSVETKSHAGIMRTV